MVKLVSVRKNLNVNIENERKIQRFRSICLGMQNPIDLDYTGSLNMMVELGTTLLDHLPIASDRKVSWNGEARVTMKAVSDVMMKYIFPPMSDLEEADLQQQIDGLIYSLEVSRTVRDLSRHSPKRPIVSTEEGS